MGFFRKKQKCFIFSNESSSPMAATKAWGSQIPLCGDACKESFIKTLLLNLSLIKWGWETRILWCKKECKYQVCTFEQHLILIPIPVVHTGNVEPGWDEVLHQVSHWNQWIFRHLVIISASNTPFPLPGQDTRNGPAWITEFLALFLKPWCSSAIQIHFCQTFPQPGWCVQNTSGAFGERNGD